MLVIRLLHGFAISTCHFRDHCPPASPPPARRDQQIERVALKALVGREHDMAVEFLYAELAAAHEIAELVVMGDVAADHAHQIIDPAADLVAFEHFVALADRGEKTLEIRLPMVFENDLDEKQHRAADLGEIEIRDIAADEPVLLQRLHPVEAGARRKMHLLGEADIADPRVELKPPHDPEVHFIDIMSARHGSLA